MARRDVASVGDASPVPQPARTKRSRPVRQHSDGRCAIEGHIGEGAARIEPVANVHEGADHAVAGDLFRRLIAAPDLDPPGCGNGADHEGTCLRSTWRRVAAARSAHVVFGLYKHDSGTQLRPNGRSARSG